MHGATGEGATFIQNVTAEIVGGLAIVGILALGGFAIRTVRRRRQTQRASSNDVKAHNATARREVLREQVIEVANARGMTLAVTSKG